MMIPADAQHGSENVNLGGSGRFIYYSSDRWSGVIARESKPNGTCRSIGCRVVVVGNLQDIFGDDVDVIVNGEYFIPFDSHHPPDSEFVCVCVCVCVCVFRYTS